MHMLHTITNICMTALAGSNTLPQRPNCSEQLARQAPGCPTTSKARLTEDLAQDVCPVDFPLSLDVLLCSLTGATLCCMCCLSPVTTVIKHCGMMGILSGIHEVDCLFDGCHSASHCLQICCRFCCPVCWRVAIELHGCEVGHFAGGSVLK